MTFDQVKMIRQEIFKLAKLSPNVRIMHWYMWLDDCFENDEFHKDEFGNIKWRCGALQDLEKERVNDLLTLITVLLQCEGIAKGV